MNQCFGRPRTADIKCLTMHLLAWTWFQNMTYPPLETNSNFALEKTMGLEWMECPFGWDVLPIFRGYAAMQGVALGNKKTGNRTIGGKMHGCRDPGSFRPHAWLRTLFPCKAACCRKVSSCSRDHVRASAETTWVDNRGGPQTFRVGRNRLWLDCHV